MKQQELVDLIAESKIIAIARGVAPEDAMPLAEALYAGGIRLLEFPFNMKDMDSRHSDDCMKLVSKGMVGKMYVGCGTASYPELVDRAYEAGASYIISADTNPDVIKRSKELGLLSMPGVATGTDVMTAHRAGADYAKLFPAGDLGLSYLKALQGPFGHIKYMAVGGIDLDNMADFLKAGCVAVGLGSSLVNHTWIKAGEFDKITTLAKEYVAKAKECH